MFLYGRSVLTTDHEFAGFFRNIGGSSVGGVITVVVGGGVGNGAVGSGNNDGGSDIRGSPDKFKTN